MENQKELLIQVCIKESLNILDLWGMNLNNPNLTWEKLKKSGNVSQYINHILQELHLLQEVEYRWQQIRREWSYLEEQQMKKKKILSIVSSIMICRQLQSPKLIAQVCFPHGHEALVCYDSPFEKKERKRRKTGSFIYFFGLIFRLVRKGRSNNNNNKIPKRKYLKIKIRAMMKNLQNMITKKTNPIKTRTQKIKKVGNSFCIM